jgi:hypothetical protein
VDTLLIPKGTLCYVNALEGEVWMAQGVPQRRWLHDMEVDAWAATINETRYGSNARSSTGPPDRPPARVSSAADTRSD